MNILFPQTRVATSMRVICDLPWHFDHLKFTFAHEVLVKLPKKNLRVGNSNLGLGVSNWQGHKANDTS